MDEIIKKVKIIREKAYNLKGSYEDSYIFLMNELDKLISEHN